MATDRIPNPTDQVALDFLADHGAQVQGYLTTFTRDPDEAADLLGEIVLRLLVECRAGRHAGATRRLGDHRRTEPRDQPRPPPTDRRSRPRMAAPAGCRPDSRGRPGGP